MSKKTNKVSEVFVDTISGKTRVDFFRDDENAVYHPGKESCKRIQWLIDNGSLYLEYSWVGTTGIQLCFSANV